MPCAPERRRRLCRAILAAAVALCLDAHAPGAAADTPSHVEKLTLDELMARFAASRGVSAHFVEEKHLSLLVHPLQSEGMIYFVPPRRLARHVSRPLPSSLIVDGDTLAIRTRSGVDRVDLGASEVARHFVDGFIVLFSGDLAELQRRYEVEFEADDARWRIDLVPRQRVVGHMIRSIALRGRNLALEQMDVLETGGDRTLTRFDAIDSDRRFGADEIDALFDPDESTPVE